VNAHWRTLAGGFAFALSYGDHSGIPIGIDIEAIVSRLGKRKRQVWRIDFPHFAVLQMAHMDIQCALVE
jgi:hypothetical protein